MQDAVDAVEAMLGATRAPKSDAAPKYDACMSAFVKTFRDAARYTDASTFFRDFVALSFYALYNSSERRPFGLWHTDNKAWQAHEDDYLRIVKKYDKEQVSACSLLLAHVVNGLSDRWCDFLGAAYMALEISNKNTGQFFTPYHLSQFIAGITLPPADDRWEDRQRYLTVCDPACGAGSMPIAACEIIAQRDPTLLRRVYVACTDVDIVCVRMCYIQLALLGVSAHVFHGNSLSMESYACFGTPALYLTGMAWCDVWGNDGTPRSETQTQLATWAALHRAAAEHHGQYIATQ